MCPGPPLIMYQSQVFFFFFGCAESSLLPGLSLVAAPGLQRTGSTVVAYRLSCSKTCRIFPNQGPKPCLLHWKADSSSLSHQGSPSQDLKSSSHLQTQCPFQHSIFPQASLFWASPFISPVLGFPSWKVRAKIHHQIKFPKWVTKTSLRFFGHPGVTETKCLSPLLEILMEIDR